MIKTAVVKIDGVDRIIGCDLKVLFAFEEMTKKSFDGSTQKDLYLLFYASLMVYNPTFEKDWDSFIELCNKDLTLIHSFLPLLEEFSNRMAGKEQTTQKKKRVEKEEKN